MSEFVALPVRLVSALVVVGVGFLGGWLLYAMIEIDPAFLHELISPGSNKPTITLSHSPTLTAGIQNFPLREISCVKEKGLPIALTLTVEDLDESIMLQAKAKLVSPKSVTLEWESLFAANLEMAEGYWQATIVDQKTGSTRDEQGDGWELGPGKFTVELHQR